MSDHQHRFKKAFNALLQFDRFGSPINLSIKNQETHKTFVGATASLGIAALVMFSLVSLFYDMLYTQIPNVVSNQTYDPNPQVFKILPDQYLLGITVTDNYGNPLKQTVDAMIYQAQARYCYRQMYMKDGLVDFFTNCTSFDLVPCGSANIDPKLLIALQIEPRMLSAFYCINTTEWAGDNLAYQGTASSAELQTMNLRIQPCVKGQVKNQKCAPQATINASLSNCYAAIVIPNYLLNQKAGGNPYTSSYKLITTVLTNTQLTFMQIFMQPSNTTTTKAYFHYFGNTVKHNQLQYSRQSQYFQQIPSDGEIASFTIMLDEQRVDYFRTYNDIFFVLANIGGLTNTLIFLGNILLKPLSKLSLDLFLVNKIFTFEEKTEHKKQSKSSIAKESQRKLKKNKSIVFLQQYKPSQQVTQKHLTDLNTNVAWLKSLFKQKIIKAKFTLLEYIFQCFPGQKAQLIKTGVDKIYQKLDSLYIIKKLIEIDKLKALLLNDQQIKLFEQLPKPALSKEDLNDNYIIRDTPNISVVEREHDSETHKNEFDIFHRQKPFLEQLQEVFDAYQQISENPNELDKKLLSLLDKNVVHIFEQVGTIRKSSKQVLVLDTPKDSIRGSQEGTEKDFQDDELLDNQRQFIRCYDQKKNIK